jgi:hypothetical protein
MVENAMEQYRVLATQALAEASRMSDPVARREMCQIAVGYWFLSRRSLKGCGERETTTPPMMSRSYSPECLNTICIAFREAWDILSPQLGENPRDRETIQKKLAQVTLSLAEEDVRDPAALRDAVLQATVLYPTSRVVGPSHGYSGTGSNPT